MFGSQLRSSNYVDIDFCYSINVEEILPNEFDMMHIFARSKTKHWRNEIVTLPFLTSAVVRFVQPTIRLIRFHLSVYVHRIFTPFFYIYAPRLCDGQWTNYFYYFRNNKKVGQENLSFRQTMLLAKTLQFYAMKLLPKLNELVCGGVFFIWFSVVWFLLFTATLHRLFSFSHSVRFRECLFQA